MLLSIMGIRWQKHFSIYFPILDCNLITSWSITKIKSVYYFFNSDCYIYLTFLIVIFRYASFFFRKDGEYVGQKKRYAKLQRKETY